MIDESAHKVFDYGMKDWHDFRTHKCSHCSRQLDIYYCESRLYLVRCKHCKIVSLVEAGNPNEAAEKVSRRAAPENKIEGECTMDKKSEEIFNKLYGLHDRYDEDPKHMICAEAADHIKKLSEELEKFKAAPENKALTVFDKITESPEKLAKFLGAIDIGKIELDECFCKSNCGDDDGCPHELQCIINWLDKPEGSEKS